MIRRGKRDGWLHLTAEALPPFLRFQNIRASGVQVASTADRGNALVATRPLHDPSEPLLVIPPDIILSKEAVWLQIGRAHV